MKPNQDLYIRTNATELTQNSLMTLSKNHNEDNTSSVQQINDIIIRDPIEAYPTSNFVQAKRPIVTLNQKV